MSVFAVPAIKESYVFQPLRSLQSANLERVNQCAVRRISCNALRERVLSWARVRLASKMENTGVGNVTWTYYIVVTIIVAVFIRVVLYILDLCKVKEPRKDTTVKNEASLASVKEKTSPAAPAGKQSKKKQAASWKTKEAFSHPYLATNLMGHTGKILNMDCSSNGKYLISCDEDRSIYFWELKDPQSKIRRSVRINIEFDHATHVACSPDDKAFIIHKGIENCIEVYKIVKKRDGIPYVTSKAFAFEKVHVEDIVGFGISLNGKFMMSCSSKNDLIVWNLKGEQLARIETHLMTTFKAKITPCARFIVASGFVGDVIVWEVVFDKTRQFKQVVRAFELSGHRSGVYDFAFSAGTSHIATVSKDGTWKLFNTNVNFSRGEMVQLLKTGNYTQASTPSIISLSPNADTVAVATLNWIQIFNTASGKLTETIEDVFTGEITSMLFDPTGKILLLSGDKTIRVFYNLKG